MADYTRPRDLVAALARRASSPCTVLAGGTDHYPARVGGHADEAILDISAIADLRGIHAAAGTVRIGATTTWSAIIAAPLPRAFDGLKRAAREVGGVQIQNRGTIGGNLCNASPAADGVPALLALDALVELASPAGTTTMALGDFLVGNRRTRLAADQLLSAVIVPVQPDAARSAFVKLGARRYLVISIAMVAVVVRPAADGTIAAAAVSVGACSAVARRLAALEADLVGRPLRPGLGGVAHPDHLAGLAPIDDVRGSAAYRVAAARVLVARALEEVAAP